MKKSDNAPAHMALYRKYRPADWGEVIGQEHIVKVLEGELKNGKISHAYLFSGTRGTGKTTIARIFARALGCSESDIYEIDAASNRGIDDIRELRDSVRTLPFDSPYKVYIIDEVHMLTKDAFNALLKTLEEPPQYVVFILATTELHKVLDTVISRCQSFVFKKPSQKTLKDMTLKVAKAEGITIAPASADLIALLGDGSFRDTQGILEKVISYSSDKKISEEEIEQVTGAPPSGLVNDVISAIAEGNIEKGMTAIETGVSGNVAMDVFMKLILHKVRAVLLVRFAKHMRGQLAEDFSEDDFALIEKLATAEGKAVNSRALTLLLDASEQIPRSAIPQLPLELGLIRILEETAT